MKKALAIFCLVFVAPILAQDSPPNYLLVGGVDDEFNAFPTVEVLTPGGSCAATIADMPVAAYGMSGAYLPDSGMVQVCGGLVDGVQSRYEM